MSESFERLVPGLAGEYRITVAKEHTALHLGSGRVEVLATPEMVRVMERAAVAAGDHLLPAGYQTVGVRLEVSHLAATPVGLEVVGRAELVDVDGRRLRFKVEARDPHDLVGEGFHERVIIQVDRFRDRVEAKRASA